MQPMMSDKPLMLMVSHCVPDATGKSARARAWQLLKLASQTHRVYLACVFDGPVNLAQWRRLQSHAHRIVIQTRRVGGQAMGRAIGALNGPRGVMTEFSDALGEPIAQWAANLRFSAVLCTHPALWPESELVGAPLRICDLNTPTSVRHQCIASGRRAASRWWQQRLALAHDLFEREIARQCDLLTLGRVEYAQSFDDLPCRIMTVPEGVDLDHLGPLTLGASAAAMTAVESDSLDLDPTHTAQDVVIHGDWSCSGAAQFPDWFRRKAWPSIRREIPHARLRLTDQAGDSLASLRTASVVIVPEPDHRLARWPILQSMAVQRPIVAPRRAIADMPVRHGEQLLLTDKAGDWAGLCIESLRSTPMRLNLARSARRFVEKHFPLERCGRELTHTLCFGTAWPALARAA